MFRLHKAATVRPYVLENVKKKKIYTAMYGYSYIVFYLRRE